MASQVRSFSQKYRLAVPKWIPEPYSEFLINVKLK